MNVRITPHKLVGSVKVPPSKSLAHRAIICASLANGVSKITNVSYSNDILATIDSMRALGAEIDVFDDYVIVKGSRPKRVKDVIDANESGSTLRFMIPLALIDPNPITFVGHNKLVDRPLDTYFDIFEKHNINYTKDSNHYLPLTCSNQLTGGTYYLEGNVSSQFITGLLFALPLCASDSKIIITTKIESLGYINLTLDILKKYGIDIEYKDNGFIIKGNQEYKPFDYEVEGDFSQVAFFLAANMLGNDVKIEGVNMHSLQGDKEIVVDIQKLGATIKYENNSLITSVNELKNVNIDVSQTPDLGPALSVIFTQAEGTSKLVNASRLRIKECDRITCVKEELNKLGANTSETEDSLIVNGKTNIKGGTIDSHNDHRLVMAFAMIATIADSDIVIMNAGAVKKSYPDFFKDYISLGGIVKYE